MFEYVLEDLVAETMTMFSCFALFGNIGVMGVLFGSRFTVLKIYSMILFVYCMASVLVSTGILMTEPSVFYHHNATIVSFNGYCTYLLYNDVETESRICQFNYDMVVHGVVFLQLLLLASFAFRYLVLAMDTLDKYTKIVKFIVYALLFLFTCIAAAFFGFHFHSIWYPFEEITEVVSQIRPSLLNTRRGYYAVKWKGNPFETVLFTLWFLLPWVVIFCAMYLRWTIGKKLESSRNISYKFEKTHNEKTANALALQAMSSLLLASVNSVYLFGEYFEIEFLSFVEVLLPLPVAIMSFVNPLAILLYVQPIRAYIKNYVDRQHNAERILPPPNHIPIPSARENRVTPIQLSAADLNPSARPIRASPTPNLVGRRQNRVNAIQTVSKSVMTSSL